MKEFWAEGRLAQSMAFFSPPGMERYSSKKGCLFSRDASSLHLKGAEDGICPARKRLHVEAAMGGRSSQGSRPHGDAAVVIRQGEMPIVALRDDDLIAATGGALLASAVSNALKTLGEGLSAAARKG